MSDAKRAQRGVAAGARSAVKRQARSARPADAAGGEA
jgi:hypothetical protein